MAELVGALKKIDERRDDARPLQIRQGTVDRTASELGEQEAIEHRTERRGKLSDTEVDTGSSQPCREELLEPQGHLFLPPRSRGAARELLDEQGNTPAAVDDPALLVQAQGRPFCYL